MEGKVESVYVRKRICYINRQTKIDTSIDGVRGREKEKRKEIRGRNILKMKINNK